MIRVTVWNENIHEKTDKAVSRIYPKGIHGAIAAALNKQKGIKAATATLDMPGQGLTDEILNKTDVLVYWAHMGHGDVRDENVDRIQKRILNGMGFIPLHSAHYSKIFKRMMGTICLLRWREANDNERLWCTNPAHPIAEGIGDYFDLKHEEMYGEHFDIPHPEALVFVSWFKGGEVFRSGCCYHRGKGKIFYFRPGHETYPTYYDKNVIKVITNAVRWATPLTKGPNLAEGKSEKPLEKL